MKTKIAVSGVGYVGLTTAACLAQLGHDVVGYDVDCEKIASLREGKVGFSEPGLSELVVANIGAGRLRFTTTPEEAMRDAEIAFICVGTPSDTAGRADLSHVFATAVTLASAASRSFVVVMKSTAPSGSAERVAALVTEHARPGIRSAVVANPEFLREGSAIRDFFETDRVVIGSWNRAAAETVAALYAPLHAPVVITDPPTAQLIKYASNAFLATKISFINEIARIADAVGANTRVVAAGMGFDERIGGAFLDAGLGYGGSCFPKDVLALATLAEDHADGPSDLLRAVIEINTARRRFAVDLLRDAVLGDLQGRQICVLGLAFKPDTDDVRDAPAFEIISMLCESGALVHAYDPVATSAARRVVPSHDALRYCADAYEAASGSSALLIATDWPEFRELDWQRVRRSMVGGTIVDGRGLLQQEEMSALGFTYVGMAG